MSKPIDPKLVQEIAAQVMAKLGMSRPDPMALIGQLPPPVHIAPPIGVCTGDYSKYPELAGRSAASPTRPSVGPEPSDAGSEPVVPVVPAQLIEPVPLSGIVTAAQLQSAIDAAPGRVALLASDARPTPLAHDLIRQHPDRVRYAASARATGSSRADGSESDARPGRDDTWLWWIDGRCPAVHELTQRLRSRLRTCGANRSPSSLADVIRTLAVSVRCGAAAGGLLFVGSAARAMCMANRCPSLRAVQGTCVEAVDEAVRELSANVLIVEYPRHGLRSLSEMVERVMRDVPRVSPVVQRELTDLQRM